MVVWRRLLICTASCLIMAFLLMLNPPDYVALVLLAALLHEVGHLTAALILKVPIRDFYAAPFGFKLTFDFSGASYIRECAVAAAGACANFITAAAVLPFVHGSRRMLFFTIVSAACGVFNLLPLTGCDGGVMLSSLLHRRLSADIAYMACRTVSVIFSLVLWCAAVYLQIKAGGNMTLLIMSVYLLVLVLK